MYYNSMVRKMKLWPNWQMVHAACVDAGKDTEDIRMYVHPQQECNSLLKSNEKLSLHGGTCTGKAK